MDTSEIVLETESEAQAVLDAMKDILRKYEVVTFADMLELVGIASVFTDNKIGWTGLRTAQIKPLRGGYILDLPQAQPVN
jgi:hypothetical protein